MEINHLNSLRLGFSTSEAEQIELLGLRKFISNQLNANNTLLLPDFLVDKPRNKEELRVFVSNRENNLNHLHERWRAFFLQRCFETPWPVREKINLFFQNHFVATQRIARVPYHTYCYYKAINDYSTGNYKDLVKAMVYSNAILIFLNNNHNRKNRINENLARELLELFTLGEGNYTESDVRNTALVLAGLTVGVEKGFYDPRHMVNGEKTVFGKSGDFIIDDVIDLIFEQNNTPLLLTEKVLKWFFYDSPPQEKIAYYARILVENDFELKPYFQRLFEEECQNTQGGNQIKNPLIFIFQIFKDLNLEPNYIFFAAQLRDEGMNAFNQNNVKGWVGGTDWLSTQLYKSRQQLVDFFTFGNIAYEDKMNRMLALRDGSSISLQPKLKLKDSSSGAKIAKELTQRMIFETNEQMNQDLNELLDYKFDDMSQNAAKMGLLAYQYLAKTPEFQII